MFNSVILVDDNNRQTGEMEKLKAHIEGRLHRAFSIFIFNNKGELMLQQRNPTKYHSGGLWTNTCCSHPFPGETTSNAANRRLYEEMGFHCSLTEKSVMTYRAVLDNGITENEIDHIFLGEYNKEPIINTVEVQNWMWITPEDLVSKIASQPEKFSSWIKLIIEQGHLKPLFNRHR